MAICGNVARRALACACTTSAMLACVVAPASASISIGQLDPGTPSESCTGPSTWVQSTEAAAPAYTAPPGQWTIVSWSHRASAATGRDLGIRVFRTAQADGQYTLVGAGASRTLTPGGINTFYERISIAGGDLLGLRAGPGASCVFGAAPGDTVRYSASAEPGQGGSMTLGTTTTARRLNMTARLEADTDSDGFGDETQDHCPGTSGPLSGCVPGGSAAKDTTRPLATVSGRRDSIRDGHVAVWVRASEAGRVTGRGSIRVGSRARLYRLDPVSAGVTPNRRVRVSLRMSRRTRLAARRAIRRGRRAHARIRVTVRDSAGNSRSLTRRLRLVL